MGLTLFDEVKAVIRKDIPLISNLSNISAILNKMENINWCGFYLYDKEKNELYLGPFQGDVACEIIPYNKGVCGTSLKEEKTIIVDDVNKFVGHIACSSKSKSEIVVPIFNNKVIKGVIDIDSPIYNRFSINDKIELEKIASLIGELFI